MRELQLTNSDKPAIVDDWNYNYFNQWNWHVDCGHVRRITQEGIVFLRREVLHRAGCTDGDHINHNPLDNREKNLRPAIYKQNNQNQGLCSNLSGYRYVSWSRTYKNWHVGIRVHGRRATLRLGCFSNLLDAVKVADTAAIHLDRDKINLGREHYPAGLPRDWPEDAIPDCPALRRLIGD